ncbi:NACHT domain-containing protein [Qipengyuania mesophila]|uniref:NACHT domain-containing protein n=1 Tax=Qipengyuania mesophila TaxID=2867246 RepID=UPI0035197237
MEVSNDSQSIQLAIDTQGLLASFTASLLKFATTGSLQLGELPSNLIRNVKLKDQLPKALWALLSESLHKAAISLARDYDLPIGLSESDLKAVRVFEIDGSLTIKISTDFFAPKSIFQLAKQLEPSLAHWLACLGLVDVDAANASHRLGPILAKCLHETWIENPKRYEIIENSVNSPFVKVAEQITKFTYYQTTLIEGPNERVFEETFSLSSIYIEPRYYRLEKMESKEDLDFHSEAPQTAPLKVGGWLATDLREWITKSKSSDAIRIISGGPGAGKSSFAKMFAAQLAMEEIPVFLIPLHQLEMDQPPAEAVRSFFSETDIFDLDPLTYVHGDRVVIIFDGLDEIQLQGKGSTELAAQLVSGLSTWIDRLNTSKDRFRFIVTGRELSVQLADRTLKLPGKVLHLLPYYWDQEEFGNVIAPDEEGMFYADQRESWWQQYQRLKGHRPTGTPRQLLEGEIGEVTAQPLLNYLVALALEQGLELDENLNINTVYASLVTAVYKRSWADKPHPALGGVDEGEFVRLLEEIAVSVWHGAAKTTTVAEVEERCRSSGLAPLLAELKKSAASGVTSLMLAFYFRQKGRRPDGEQTFEFTHKTFMEYLVSLRVVRLIKQISKQRKENQKDLDSGWDSKTRLSP